MLSFGIKKFVTEPSRVMEEGWWENSARNLDEGAGPARVGASSVCPTEPTSSLSTQGGARHSGAGLAAGVGLTASVPDGGDWVICKMLPPPQYTSAATNLCQHESHAERTFWPLNTFCAHRSSAGVTHP